MRFIEAGREFDQASSGRGGAWWSGSGSNLAAVCTGCVQFQLRG